MALKQIISISGDAAVSQGGFSSIVQVSKSLGEAYIRVESVSATKTRAAADVSVTLPDQIVRRQYDFTPSMDGGNFIAQAYAHIKALPEFADAVDC